MGTYRVGGCVDDSLRGNVKDTKLVPQSFTTRSETASPRYRCCRLLPLGTRNALSGSLSSTPPAPRLPFLMPQRAVRPPWRSAQGFFSGLNAKPPTMRTDDFAEPTYRRSADDKVILLYCALNVYNVEEDLDIYYMEELHGWHSCFGRLVDRSHAPHVASHYT